MSLGIIFLPSLSHPHPLPHSIPVFAYVSVFAAADGKCRRAATQGKGEFTMEFSHYERAPGQVQKELVQTYLKALADRNKK